MIAHVLCPGPSLAKWHAKDLLIADVVIGVNRAARYVRCDWWVAGDVDVVRHHQPGYGVRVFTEPDVVRRVEPSPKLALYGYRDADAFCPIKEYRWNEYSACAALVLAGYLGATTIDVFGADWTNEPDWDGGKTSDLNRSPQRWGREEQFWDKTVAFLAERGIAVNRK